MRRNIRKFEPDDLAGVMAAWESANEIAHPFLTAEFTNQVRHDIPNVYLPNSETWVMEQDEQVIGFVALLGNEVGAIFVDTEFHGTGAGKALMDKAVELRGELEVEVFKANAIGCKFYDGYGFELMKESIHEPTGNAVLRLRLADAERTSG